MREVFEAAPGDDPGEVFYTVKAADAGRSTGIRTSTAGITVDFSGALGRVQEGDAGKRLYRVRDDSGTAWLWVAESAVQRDRRLRRAPAAPACGPLDRALLRRALEKARCLTEPGEVNEEYVRGQANLIADLLRLPGTCDSYHRLLMQAISHEITVSEAVTAISRLAS